MAACKHITHLPYWPTFGASVHPLFSNTPLTPAARFTDKCECKVDYNTVLSHPYESVMTSLYAEDSL